MQKNAEIARALAGTAAGENARERERRREAPSAQRPKRPTAREGRTDGPTAREGGVPIAEPADEILAALTRDELLRALVDSGAGEAREPHGGELSDAELRARLAALPACAALGDHAESTMASERICFLI